MKDNAWTQVVNAALAETAEVQKRVAEAVKLAEMMRVQAPLHADHDWKQLATETQRHGVLFTYCQDCQAYIKLTDDA